MKKQWIGFMIAGMLVAAVPTNVNAEDCYHNWSYSADYTKLDDTYHQAEYYCYYCNAKKNRKREAYLALRRDFRTINGNPRQFNYRDESAGVCISAQCKQYNNPHPLLKYKYKK